MLHSPDAFRKNENDIKKAGKGGKSKADASLKQALNDAKSSQQKSIQNIGEVDDSNSDMSTDIIANVQKSGGEQPKSNQKQPITEVAATGKGNKKLEAIR